MCNDESILVYKFPGNSLPREEFRMQAKKIFLEFLGKDINTTFFFIFNEIVKNIWDHAEGQGELRITKFTDKITFDIWDHGIHAHSLEEIRKQGSSKLESKINFGMGIASGFIESAAKSLEIKDFTIDTSCGFRYTGTFYLSGFQ